MIRLTQTDLLRAELGHGVTVIHRPVRSADIWIAQQAAVLAPAEVRRIAYVKAIARGVIVGIEGVEGPDGRPAEATPETIDALMDLYAIYARFELDVVGAALTLDAEKNASSPSPDGGTAGAPTTAPAATGSATPAQGGNTHH